MHLCALHMFLQLSQAAAASMHLSGSDPTRMFFCHYCSKILCIQESVMKEWYTEENEGMSLFGSTLSRSCPQGRCCPPAERTHLLLHHDHTAAWTLRQWCSILAFAWLQALPKELINLSCKVAATKASLLQILRYCVPNSVNREAMAKCSKMTYHMMHHLVM